MSTKEDPNLAVWKETKKRLTAAIPDAIAVLHDTTDLERLEQVRKDFVANVSHEMRTPLAAIAGYAETLLDLVETIAPGIRDAIEEVDVATPLTLTRYLGHPGGAIYGYDQDATESWLFRNTERESHVPGLHLAGSWSGFGGFQPTLEAGARVARRLLRYKAA